MRVALGKRYDRGEGNRWASRNGRVSLISRAKPLALRFAAFASLGALCASRTPEPPRPPQARSWTFVRDPLSHFVAGYTEAMVRARVTGRVTPAHTEGPWTGSKVRQLLVALVRGDTKTLQEWGGREQYHMYPMTRIAQAQPQVRPRPFAPQAEARDGSWCVVAVGEPMRSRPVRWQHSAHPPLQPETPLNPRP